MRRNAVTVAVRFATGGIVADNPAPTLVRVKPLELNRPVNEPPSFSVQRRAEPVLDVKPSSELAYPHPLSVPCDLRPRRRMFPSSPLINPYPQSLTCQEISSPLVTQSGDTKGHVEPWIKGGNESCRFRSLLEIFSVLKLKDSSRDQRFLYRATREQESHLALADERVDEGLLGILQ